MSWAYVNNSFQRKEEATISPYDRGFLFGDGVYVMVTTIISMHIAIAHIATIFTESIVLLFIVFPFYYVP